MVLMPALSTSLSGMKVAQNQLDIVSRNVANVDTVGYTRKTAQQNNLVLAGSSMGVQLGTIGREVNEGLLRSFLSSNSTTGNYSAQNEYLSKAETLLGTPQGDNSIAANVASLQAAFDTFSSDVTSAAGRYDLLNNAQTLTSRLNSISTEIQLLRGDADEAIAGNVEEINELLVQLDDLNEKIVKYSVLGYDGVPDLEDQRDEALRSLSEKIDITYFKRENGAIVIQTTNGAMLLDNEPHKLSHSAIAQASPTTSYESGGIGGIYVDGQDITKTIRDGEIKGLIDIRDSTLPSLQSQLDELAGVLKSQINAIHNQGTAFPSTPSTLTGTRTFIDPTRQGIQIEGGDVRLTIFDRDGNQVSTAALVGDLGFSEGTISDMTTVIQDWLRSANGPNLPQATVSVDDNGALVIDTGDSYYGLSIIDEATSTPGSTQQDVSIKFSANGSQNYDREFSGFSNFFGLNDFFVSHQEEAIYDSNVLSSNVKLGINDPVVLGFSDSTRGLNFGSVVINPSDSLSDIVNKINKEQSLNGVQASLIPNGNGVVLRITNTSGEQLEITENRLNGDPSPGLIDRLGIKPSNAGMAESIAVRQELLENPTLIAGASPEFNQNAGEYQQNPSGNNIANAMAQAFASSQSFAQSGSIAEMKTTLANYASTFVGTIASATSNTESTLAYYQELTNSIATKEATISGVDLDEELGQMIIFQQTYAANAQAFTAAKEILDMLLNII